MEKVILFMAIMLMCDTSAVLSGLAMFYAAADKKMTSFICVMLSFISGAVAYIPAVFAFLSTNYMDGVFCLLITIIDKEYIRRHNPARSFVAGYDISRNLVMNSRNAFICKQTIQHYKQICERTKRDINAMIDKGDLERVRELTKHYNTVNLAMQEEELKYKNFLDLKVRVKKELGY